MQPEQAEQPSSQPKHRVMETPALHPFTHMQGQVPAGMTLTAHGASVHPSGSLGQDPKHRVMTVYPNLPGYFYNNAAAVARIDALLQARGQHQDKSKRDQADVELRQLGAIDQAIGSLLNEEDGQFMWEGASVRGKDILAKLMNSDTA